MQFKLFLKFLRYLLPYRKRQLVILSLSGGSVLLGIVIPYISKLVVDKAILSRDLKTFIVLGIIGTGVFILNGLASALKGFLERGLHLRVGFDLSRKVFSHLQGLGLDFFRDKSTGEHLFKLNYDIERAADLVVSVPGESVNIFPKLFFILLIIFHLDWQMAFFSLLLAPILYLPVYYFTRRMRKVLEELWSDSENIFKRLEEVLSHIYLVKAFGKESSEIRHYLKRLIANIRINLKNTKLEVISNFAAGSFERVIIGLIAIFGGYQVIRGRVTAGTLTAIMIYLSQLVALQNNIAFFFQRIVLGLLSCGRLDGILRQRPKTGEITARKRMIFREPGIEFSKVSFGYHPGEPVLKDLGFNLEKGLLALAGASGGGKSTVLNLILRLYEPWQGDIFIERHNLKDLELSSLKEQVGVVLQEPFLWNDTIENNIRYARIGAGRKEIVWAAKMSGVSEFAENQTRGYETMIGENACRLSEGQKQKIAIARALIKRPKILILDEAMSSMDSLSEERIIANLRDIPDIHTVIIVTHRLSTLMACDRAYFLKKPDTMVIERPQNLIHNDKEFYDLFSAQINSR